MILAPAIVEVKPAPVATVPAIAIIPADPETFDLADDFGPPDDSPLWDEMADEAMAMDRLDAGLLPW